MYPTNYYIALGTNVGNYINNFSNAILELKKIGQVVKMAHIYKSKPYGYLKQNFFYNTTVHLKSEILPIELINKIQLIERKLKKNKRIINGPRKIDLDIILNNLNEVEKSLPNKLFYGGMVLFVKGEKSNYINDSNINSLINQFPKYKIVEIQNAGHWVHAENLNDFIKETLLFLES